MPFNHACNSATNYLWQEYLDGKISEAEYKRQAFDTSMQYAKIRDLEERANRNRRHFGDPSWRMGPC